MQSRYFSVLILLCSFFTLGAQTSEEQNSTQRSDLRIMFWNVENLFDTKNDSLTRDEEFLPESDKAWTNHRYWEKVKKIYKLIAVLGQEAPPELIGLCEIENKQVLQNLIHDTPLSKYQYGIIHKDSPDKRGIDVALLYRKDALTLSESNFHKITFPNSQGKTTRDILQFSGVVKSNDSEIVVFVNHWPSRRGGVEKSEKYRIRAATILHDKIREIQTDNNCMNIVVTGDFNDNPANRSISEVLLSGEVEASCNNLVNLSGNLQKQCRCGTYKYKASWNMLDQIIVSQSLLHGVKGLGVKGEVVIYNPKFLVHEDIKYGGDKPYRTYLGPRYLNGFSDHFPIYIDLEVVE